MSIEEERRIRNRRAKLLRLGRPSRIRPDEYAKVLARLRLLNSKYGMSAREIAQLLGDKDPEGTGINAHLRGDRFTMLRSNYDRIMAIPPPVEIGNCKLPTVIPRRKLHALIAAGYPNLFMAEYVGINYSNLNKMTLGQTSFIHAKTAAVIDGMYAKLAGTEPAHVGICGLAISRAKNVARRRGYPPPHCWDEDTIDNPGAVPEWTGACGRLAGALIHLRDDIPMCPACQAICDSPTSKVDPFELHRRFNAGESATEVRTAMGVKRDLLYQYWRILTATQPRHTLELVNTVEMTGYCYQCGERMEIRTRGEGRYVCIAQVRAWKAAEKAKRSG